MTSYFYDAAASKLIVARDDGTLTSLDPLSAEGPAPRSPNTTAQVAQGNMADKKLQRENHPDITMPGLTQEQGIREEDKSALEAARHWREGAVPC